MQRRMSLAFVWVVPLFFSVQVCLLGADPMELVINEIAWMGTSFSNNHEWIELFNNTQSPVDLTGWVLIAQDETPAITLNGIIPARGYFLLERTNDNTIADVTANQIYTGVLSNSGECLFLKDAEGHVVDEVSHLGGWYGGDNESKATMERHHPQMAGSAAGSWGTNDGITRNGTDAGGQPINGTPGAQNSNYDVSLSVGISRFTAGVSGLGVRLFWKAESEVDMLGYFVLRSDSPAGPYAQRNGSVIQAGENSSSVREYEFLDRDVLENRVYRYKLKAVELNGSEEQFGPIEVSTASVKLENEFCENYPNPFNPSTTIRYTIGEVQGRRVVLRIVDLLGREVVRLVDEIPKPGEHLVPWDGLDTKGLPVASGLYFSVLECDGKTVFVRSMLKKK